MIKIILPKCDHCGRELTSPFITKNINSFCDKECLKNFSVIKPKIKFKKNEVNYKFFETNYFINKLTGKTIVENNQLYYEYEGESYQINKLYLDGKVSCDEVKKLNISDVAKENFCNYVKKHGFDMARKLVESYTKTSYIIVSNSRKKYTNEALEILKVKIDKALKFGYTVEKPNKQKQPACFDGKCIEKKVLSGEIALFAKEVF